MPIVESRKIVRPKAKFVEVSVVLRVFQIKNAFPINSVFQVRVRLPIVVQCQSAKVDKYARKISVLLVPKMLSVRLVNFVWEVLARLETAS